MARICYSLLFEEIFIFVCKKKGQFQFLGRSKFRKKYILSLDVWLSYIL
jgi:hypothetical protein